MTLVQRPAGRLTMYVEEIEGFAQARNGTTHWTNDLPVAVRTDVVEANPATERSSVP